MGSPRSWGSIDAVGQGKCMATRPPIGVRPIARAPRAIDQARRPRSTRGRRGARGAASAHHPESRRRSRRRTARARARRRDTPRPRGRRRRRGGDRARPSASAGFVAARFQARTTTASSSAFATSRPWMISGSPSSSRSPTAICAPDAVEALVMAGVVAESRAGRPSRPAQTNEGLAARRGERGRGEGVELAAHRRAARGARRRARKA